MRSTFRPHLVEEMEDVMPTYRTILFCTDFSRHADEAFEEASYLAALSQARLQVLHVIPWGTGEAAQALPEIQREAEDNQLLDALKYKYGSPRDFGADFAVRRGEVTTEILDMASESKADIIIMGARGIGRLEGFLVGGSVAERVARHAPVPVLLVAREEDRSQTIRPKTFRQQASVAHEEHIGLVLQEIREAQERERRERQAQEQERQVHEPEHA